MNNKSETYLGPLIVEAPKLKREAVRRRKLFYEKSIAAEALAEYEADGWIVDKNLKKVIKVKKEKAIDERLENKFWMLLFKLGYPELNNGRSFSMLIDRKNAEPLRKQVDVFGKDDETVVVAECKSAEKLTRKSLQKDIEEFANLKGPIANSIKKHYGPDFKPKIIWLFVTENIRWSDPDRQRAIGQNIRIITEKELRYFTQIGDHLGKAARYQFLAEFLKDQPIPELSGKKVPAIKGKLGGKSFFCFVTTPRHLLKISFVNHRSLFDPEGAPTYQRLITRARLRDINSFVRAGGYFPNNILINFTRNIRFDKLFADEDSGVTYGQLYLPDKYRSAWIIDGQHRLYGFSHIEDKYLDQNIIIVAFDSLSKEEEANLFVTINHEQRSVPKHLLDDLEGELKWGSQIPSERIGAIGSRLINVLNADIGEPFYNRITQQGLPATNRACLTIPAIKDAFRKSGLIGRSLMNNQSYELGPLCGKNDSETLERARCALNQYFNLIRNANLPEWENGRDGNICTNVSVQAYTILLGSLIKYWEQNTASDSREMPFDDIFIDIEDYLKPITDFLENNNALSIRAAFNVPFGSGGPVEYYYRLCRMIKYQCSDFQPEGMGDWEAEQSEEKISEADHRLKEIVKEMRRHIFDVFRAIYGEEKDAYWHKGIPDKGIKGDAYRRSLDQESDETLPLETYLEILEMKKIVENKQNWQYFKNAFNIPEPGEKGLAKNLRWMDRINELRRIAAHPAKERHYRSEDFEYIGFIYNEFIARVNEAQKNPVLEILEGAVGNAN